MNDRQNTKLDVFISHIEEDGALAEKLTTIIEGAGYHVWVYERDSLPGQTYIEQIVRAIDATQVFLLIISPRTLDSLQVDREVVRAFQQGKAILPVIREMTMVSFQKKRPAWDHMLGAAGAIVIPQGGVNEVLPRLMAGLRALNVISDKERCLHNAIGDLPSQQVSVTAATTAQATNVSGGEQRPNVSHSTGISLSEFASQFGMQTAEVMRLAFEVLHLEFRTPSGRLSLDQMETLRAACALKKKSIAGGSQDSLRPPLKLDFGGGVTLELVSVPLGRFRMGSPSEEEGHNDDEIEHEVRITRPLYMGKYPITQSQFEQLMKFNPSYFKGPDLPVELVSWFDAQSYCDCLFEKFGKRFRLPTEAEWEYACRAGTTTPFSTGNTITTRQSNFDGKFTYAGQTRGETRWHTTPVVEFPPNPWGLHDMHGNVWEWCADWYGTYSSDPSSDPQGAPEGDLRVLRGGSWFNSPADCRSAQRDALDPGRRHSLYGFRVVMNAD